MLLHLAWAFLTPDAHALASVSLAITMTYVGLMALRPYAQIGLAVVPAAHLVAQFAGGAARGAEVEVVGAAITSVLLGLLLFGTRVTTERRFAQALEAAAAANALLERANRTDPLTGLANRRHLGEVLADVWPSAREISVLMIDIDHFKPYNDHYGHLGGDRCLEQVAAALDGASPEADLVARFGGEEFIVVLSGAGLERARAVGERVRQAVADLALEHVQAPSGRVSVSVGAATARPGDGGCEADLIRRADEALYDAKRNGRDRVAA
ncbi:GGDEF domain-containing protein [Paractinoplanes rishiriensis]|uniref:GGDEF domain-containing protein n=1 Tax=Paractinoplanes rishiriensis TaxID=1050105 RepID=A0A919MXH5_9ACTN|nr:GGDEF domain-containing protein [Actinoplanes rishiriensis]GIE98903.1 hypothetical protein Ari01nite_63680 [Actinoplanes rishiriensis]